MLIFIVCAVVNQHSNKAIVSEFAKGRRDRGRGGQGFLRRSSGKNMQGLLHVAVGGRRRFLRTTAVGQEHSRTSALRVAQDLLQETHSPLEEIPMQLYKRSPVA